MEPIVKVRICGPPCLICQAEIPLEEVKDKEGSGSVLSAHLKVVFLLRTVLEVPVPLVSQFLEGSSDVDNWVKICSPCRALVEESWLFYRELWEAHRKWTERKGRVVDTMKGSLKPHESYQPKNEVMLDIAKLTRRFVSNYMYAPVATNPFVEGDARAAWVHEMKQERPEKVEVSDRELEDNTNMISCVEDDNLENPIEEAVDEKQSIHLVITGIPEVDPLSEPGDPKSRFNSQTSGVPFCRRCGRNFPLDKSEGTLRQHKRSCSKHRAWLEQQQKKRLKQQHCPGGAEAGLISCGMPGCLHTWTIDQASIYPNHYATTVHASNVGRRKFVFQCTKCQRLFETENRLRTHLLGLPVTYKPKAFNPPDAVRISCGVPECSSIFTDYPAFVAHKNECHVTIANTNPTFECIQCGDLQKKRQLMEQHLKTHDTTVCCFCDKQFPNKHGLQKHQRLSLTCKRKRGMTPAEAMHVCQICGAGLATKPSLREHISTVHERNYKFRCELCGRGCRDKGHLNIHLCETHGVGGFQCEEPGCEVRMPSERLLKCHVNQKHRNGEPEFKCGECGKGFHFAKYLRQHHRHVHEGIPWGGTANRKKNST